MRRAVRIHQSVHVRSGHLPQQGAVHRALCLLATDNNNTNN